MSSHEEPIETEVDFTYPSISQILNNFHQTFDKKMFTNYLYVMNKLNMLNLLQDSKTTVHYGINLDMEG